MGFGEYLRNRNWGIDKISSVFMACSLKTIVIWLWKVIQPYIEPEVGEARRIGYLGSFLQTLFFFFLKYLFIYLWLCWVFISARGLSPVVASRGHSSSRCTDLSLSRPFLLRSTGSRRAGSAIVAHGPSCSAACGILPDQGSNPCPLHWQADSHPLRHQGSPQGSPQTLF